MIKMSRIYIKKVDILIDTFTGAFDWNASPQGGDYWIKVLDNLHGIRQTAIEEREELVTRLQVIIDTAVDRCTDLGQGQHVSSESIAELKKLAEEL